MTLFLILFSVVGKRNDFAARPPPKILVMPHSRSVEHRGGVTTNPRLRVGLVGPDFPDKGGIARHTAVLAQHLDGLERLSVFAPWERYRPTPPTSRFERLSTREVPLNVPTIRGPRWDRPSSWMRTAGSLASIAESLLMIASSPAQLPAFAAMQSAFLNHRPGGTAALIVHNVVPHDAGLLSRLMAKRLASAGFPLLVHSERQAILARSLGAERVVVARLPYHGPPLAMLRDVRDERRRRRFGTIGAETGLRLLFLGFVRPYKGLDILLEALHLAQKPHLLNVVGEFWTSPEAFARRAAALGLSDRVALRPGYATDADVARALADTDVLVLPYREATSSQLPRIAFGAGVPVVASDVGDLGDQIQDGVNGVLVPPSDPERLADALDRLGSTDSLARLYAGVKPPNPTAEWMDYLDAVDCTLQI